jgi:hypothetical protein
LAIAFFHGVTDSIRTEQGNKTQLLKTRKEIKQIKEENEAARFDIRSIL